MMKSHDSLQRNENELKLSLQFYFYAHKYFGEASFGVEESLWEVLFILMMLQGIMGYPVVPEEPPSV